MVNKWAKTKKIQTRYTTSITESRSVHSQLKEKFSRVNIFLSLHLAYFRVVPLPGYGRSALSRKPQNRFNIE